MTLETKLKQLFASKDYVALVELCHIHAHAQVCAMESSIPTFQIFAADLSGDQLSGTPVYYTQGLCGFASVRIKGNTAFGRWAKKTGLFQSAYPTGLYMWISDYGQSFERKETYARAFSTCLSQAGVDSYYESRLD